MGGKEIIANKRNLYDNFIKYNRSFLPLTFDINKIPANLFSMSTVFIVKPIGSKGGEGIEIVKDMSELKKAEENIKRQFKYGAIVSEYIREPMLWNGRKMHIRMYYLASIINGVVSGKLWDIGKILTARDNYKMSDYKNKYIHDTHAGTTPRDLFFPKDMPTNADNADILSQMNKIMEIVLQVYAPKAKLYSETKNAFEVFGIDFMITKDGDVKLLEVNGLDVGYEPIGENFNKITGPWSDEYSQFSRDYFEFVYENAIKPCF
jgi:hypothetical protein